MASGRGHVVKTALKVVLQRIGDRIRARGLTDGRGIFEAPGVGAGSAVLVSKGDRYAIAR